MSTANGVTKPKYMCDIRVRVEVNHPDGTVHATTVKICNAIVHPQCAHVLIPIADMAKTHGLGLCITPHSGTTFLVVDNVKIAPKGSRIMLVNRGVLLFPTVGQTTAMAGVTHGFQGATTKVTYETLHARIMHRGDQNIKYLHRCTTGVPMENGTSAWAKMVPTVKPPCDACCKGVAHNKPAPPGSHVPVVTKPGELMSIDCWDAGPVPYRWGGQTKVFGVHDHFSNLDFAFLISSEAECAGKLKQMIARARADGNDIKHIHADNAKPFTNPGVTTETCRRVCNESNPPIRFTTCCEYTPRQNGKCERRWGIRRADMCKMMAHSGATANLWWDFFRISCDVGAMLPIDGAPDECAYSRWHNGRKPKFAEVVRPGGCLCYAKYPNPVIRNKVQQQAARCMHLGRCPDQSGWKCLEVSTGRVFNSSNVDFVEDCFQGITLDRHGNEQIVPHFATDFNPNARRAPGQLQPLNAPQPPTSPSPPSRVAAGQRDAAIAATARTNNFAKAHEEQDAGCSRGNGSRRLGLRSGDDRRRCNRCAQW